MEPLNNKCVVENGYDFEGADRYAVDSRASYRDDRQSTTTDEEKLALELEFQHKPHWRITVEIILYNHSTQCRAGRSVVKL